MRSKIGRLAAILGADAMMNAEVPTYFEVLPRGAKSNCGRNRKKNVRNKKMTRMQKESRRINRRS